MENKDYLDINKVEIKRDRGDNLKKVVKPKGVLKKDLEITKSLAEDRGDVVSKPTKEKVIYPKNNKFNETLHKNFEKISKDLVTDKGNNKIILKDTHGNKAVRSTNFDKNIPIEPNKHNAAISSDKSTPANLFTDKDFILKPIKNNFIPKSKINEVITINKSLDKNVLRNIEQYESKSSNNFAPAESIIIDRDSVSKTVKEKVILKNTKPKEETKSNYFDKTAPIETISKNNRQNVSVPVVRKNIEIENHVNRILDINENKQIRDKYTFKPKAVNRNKILDNKSNAKDSQVEDNNDISKTRNNEVENVKSETFKIEKASDLTENSRKRPVIKTIIEKNYATKVYKAVIFAEQKQKSVTPLQIKIPVSLKNISVPNNVATGNTKSPKTLPNNDENSMGNKKNQNISHTDENMTGTLKKLKISPTIDNCSMNNIKISKLLHNNDKNLMRNINKPNDDDSSMNIKMPIVAATRNTKVPLVLKNILTKNTKTPHNNGDSLKRNTKLPKTKTQSKNSESVTCVKTKISKKEKKKLRESDLSHLSSVKGSKSPTTEVAKWAPSCINKHTQPYYEAWVDTTLAAITRSTGKDHENQSLIRSFKRMLEERPKTPDLVHENYLDERYIGKIKINHRQ